MKDGTLRQASKILSLFEETPGDQIQTLLESGLLADLRDGNIAEVKRGEFRRLLGFKSLNPPLLEPIGTVTISATAELFIAREKFVVDTSRSAKVKIAWLGSNFQEWFLGKTEVPAPEMSLRYSRLTRTELDGPIMAELGEAKETTLAAIYAMMERQKSGGLGALLTNSLANIFYVRDANGNLRTVYVFWHANDDGWFVRAFSVTRPSRWFDGDQVFSRSS